MKKLLLAVFLAITMLFTSLPEGYAGKTSVFVSAHYKTGHGHGWRHPGWWGHRSGWRHHHRGPHFYWRGSFVIPWHPYGYHPPPPVIIQQQPPVYVQPEQPEENYWYYCPDPQGYYPYIRNCESGWMKVVPDVTPPNP
ncbi:MAG: hypothetical protein PVF26_09015 [Desulfobacterales bacterium]